MYRLSALLTLLVALTPVLAAQPAADSALVARIYAELARGDIEAVVAALDDHVFWTEGAHSAQAGRHVGPGTVSMRVLQPLVAADAADVPDAISMDGGRVIAVGTTHRTDPATGQLVASRFHHVWRVLDGRVVSVHRSNDGCSPEPC